MWLGLPEKKKQVRAAWCGLVQAQLAQVQARLAQEEVGQDQRASRASLLWLWLLQSLPHLCLQGRRPECCWLVQAGERARLWAQEPRMGGGGGGPGEEVGRGEQAAALWPGLGLSHWRQQARAGRGWLVKAGAGGGPWLQLPRMGEVGVDQVEGAGQ